MTYKDKLRKVIKSSGLTLRDIATRCQAQNVTITYAYISQIQSGKLPPPAVKVTVAICKACNADKTDLDDLVFLGYIEKAPKIVQGYFIASSNANIDMFNLMNKVTKEEYKKHIDNLSLIQTITENIKKGWRISEKELGKDIIGKYSKFLVNISDSENELVFMPDDSMTPTIPKNSKLNIESYISLDKNKKEKVYLKPKNNDLVYYRENGKDFVRRYQKSGSTIFLKPDNNKYDIIQKNEIEIEYLLEGKIINYTVNIK